MTVIAGAPRWWAFVVRGVFGILLALFVVFVRRPALLTLVTLFGTWAIVDGIFHVAAAVAQSPVPRRPRWVLLLAGAVAVLAGILAFYVPRLTAVSLLYVIAASMGVRGIVEIAAAVPLHGAEDRGRIVIVGGVASVVMALVLLTFPDATAGDVVPWLGGYGLVLGTLLVAVGLKLRGAQRSGRHLRRIQGDRAYVRS